MPSLLTANLLSWPLLLDCSWLTGYCIDIRLVQCYSGYPFVNVLSMDLGSETGLMICYYNSIQLTMA